MFNGKSATGRRFFTCKVSAVLLLGFSVSIINNTHAHHSFAVHFIADKLITVSGTVTGFRFSNPHGIIFFTVIGENGEEQKWRGETNSPNVLKRRGWTGESLQSGQEITITGWPARNGSNLIRVSTIRFANGEELMGQPGRLPSGND